MTIDILTLIQSIDPTPDGTISEEQRDRLEHKDLSSEQEADLVRELTWLRIRNHFVDGGWHGQRELQVASELARRRALRNRRGAA